MKKLFKLLVIFFFITVPLSAEEIKVFQFTEEEFGTLKIRKVRGADTKTQYFLDSNENGNFLKAVADNAASGLGKEIKIDLKKFDDIWSDIGSDNESIDLIKIDIEGHEDFFLRGGINLIKEHRPIMLMEVAKPYYESRGVDLENIFSEG